MRFALGLLMLFGCGGPQLDGEALAEAIIAETLVEDGYTEPDVWVRLWYPPPCLGDPWTSISFQSEPGCLRGKTLYLGFGCVEALALTGAFHETSMAHEDGHCSTIDPWHTWYPDLWNVTVPRANERLAEAGL